MKDASGTVKANNLYVHNEEMPCIQISRSRTVADMEVESIEILVKGPDFAQLLQELPQVLCLVEEKRGGQQ